MLQPQVFVIVARMARESTDVTLVLLTFSPSTFTYRVDAISPKLLCLARGYASYILYAYLYMLRWNVA